VTLERDFVKSPADSRDETGGIIRFGTPLEFSGLSDVLQEMLDARHECAAMIRKCEGRLIKLYGLNEIKVERLSKDSRDAIERTRAGGRPYRGVSVSASRKNQMHFFPLVSLTLCAWLSLMFKRKGTQWANRAVAYGVVYSSIESLIPRWDFSHRNYCSRQL